MPYSSWANCLCIRTRKTHKYDCFILYRFSTTGQGTESATAEEANGVENHLENSESMDSGGNESSQGRDTSASGKS